MQYRTLGRTGVQVSSLVLGTMNFGTMGKTTQDDATAIVDGALDAGINLIDTADRYSSGESEEMVGKAIWPALAGLKRCRRSREAPIHGGENRPSRC
jgi:aryl-alcohol dehydrogenase-like predicted oxidoreductase